MLGVNGIMWCVKITVSQGMRGQRWRRGWQGGASRPKVIPGLRSPITSDNIEHTSYKQQQPPYIRIPPFITILENIDQLTLMLGVSQTRGETHPEPSGDGSTRSSAGPPSSQLVAVSWAGLSGALLLFVTSLQFSGHSG